MVGRLKGKVGTTRKVCLNLSCKACSANNSEHLGRVWRECGVLESRMAEDAIPTARSSNDNSFSFVTLHIGGVDDK